MRLAVNVRAWPSRGLRRRRPLGEKLWHLFQGRADQRQFGDEIRSISQKQPPNFVGVGQIGFGREPPLAIDLGSPSQGARRIAADIPQVRPTPEKSFVVHHFPDRKRLAGNEMAPQPGCSGANQCFKQRPIFATLPAGERLPQSAGGSDACSLIPREVQRRSEVRRADRHETCTADRCPAVQLDAAEPAAGKFGDDIAPLIIQRQIR